MYGPDIPEPVFLNLEYVFFLLYRTFHGVIDYILTGAFWNDLKVLATIIVILLITAILYCLIRLHEIKKEQQKKTAADAAEKLLAASTAVPVAKNEAWEAMRRRMLSDDESEWRLGIIEADILLDRTLTKKGYQGDTLSDKLKQIGPEKIASVQLAWEAHKIRNRIAHEGADFTFTLPEVRRALANFEAVFKELGVIDVA
ncbi:MAG TPA: hypothetical protein VLB02_01130 [Candidatus Paceibacterota bacterium]|nr:hypothetical protein [Candidatus Paceibacterota bacterium]